MKSVHAARSCSTQTGIRYHVFRDTDRENRAYVIDLRGNKVYYGTLYQCRKFVVFMKGDDNDGKLERE